MAATVGSCPFAVADEYRVHNTFAVWRDEADVGNASSVLTDLPCYRVMEEPALQ